MPKQTFFNLPQEKREHVLEVALDEFAEHGFREASISRMVARAGIAKGSFYQYFEDKQDLYEHIIRTMIADPKLRTYQEEAGALVQLNLTEFMRRVSMIQLRNFQEDPRLIRIGVDLVRNLSDPSSQKIMRHYQGMTNSYFIPFIREEKERGELDPQVDENILNYMLVSLGQYLAFLLTTDRMQTIDEGAINTLIDGLEYILTNGIYMKYRQEEPPTAD